MSSTGHPTVAQSNFQLIINALDDYARLTGIDLSKDPFAEKIQPSSSPDDILQLLQEREKAFREYRDGNRRLISCLSPAVKFIHAFAGTLGEGITLVPFPPAKAVFVGIDVLLAAASGVSSSYDALLDLFECLGSFLKRLDIYINIPPTPIMTEIIVKIMTELLSVLALAMKQIKQGRFKKFAKKLLGESEIEAALQRLDRLTQDEARVTVAQTLNVVHGFFDNMKVVMEDGQVSTDGIRHALIALQQVVNDINKMKRNQLQREIRHWLSPPDPSTNHDFIWEAHHEGTASWFFESNISIEWKAVGSLLWIHGKPGSGKSTLLSFIIEDIKGMRAAGLATMAYYYCDFRDVKKQNRSGLLSSILSQLSAQSDSFYEVLSQWYSDNAGGSGKPSSSALTKCLKDVLSLPGQGQIYIIIDALDECPNTSGMPSAREEVLVLIEELVGWNLSNVYLCIASRPEIDIRMAIEPLRPLQISLHDERGQKDDIIKYIKSKVLSDRNMRRWREGDQQLVINTLSQRANGMFRWVVCQLDNLRRHFPASICSALAELPESLDETYMQALLRIDNAKRKFARLLFQCLLVSIRPLRVEELAEVLAVQFDVAPSPTFNLDWRPIDAEEAVLAACSSLVAIVNVDDFQIVQFSHFSVQEFLESDRLANAEERLAYYHILPEPAHTVLAHVSLSVLLQLDDKIDKNTICRFPFAHYAARYWIDHARFKNVSLHIQDMMECLFHQEKPQFAAWLWLYDMDRHWVEPMSEMHPTQPEAIPLYYASLCGFRNLVERLIVAHPSDVNARGGCHVTPLHAASAMGHADIAQLLLQNNADPNSSGNEAWAPLHTASCYGHLDVVKVLLDHGIDARTRREECTPLPSENDGFEVGRLLNQRSAVVDIRDYEQHTPFFMAVAQGHLEVARLLLNSGANMNATSKNGVKPLFMAAANGNHDVSRLLLDSGSGASLHARNAAEKKPLALACQGGEHDVSPIDHGPDVDFKNDYGRTLLHAASRRGNLDCARLFLDYGADVDSKDNDGWTPLHEASRCGHLDCAQLFLDYRADVDPKDNDGWTPLHEASRWGHLDCARLFLDYGADVNTHNANHRTPLHYASANGHLDVATLLIQHGGNVDSRDNKERTPLHWASGSGYPEIAHLLIGGGAEVSSRDKNGWTPLHFASGSGCLEIARLLIRGGAEVCSQDKDGWTQLHSASGSGCLEIAHLLIEGGAEVTSRDKDGWTPLHSASSSGHLHVVKFLLECGVDVDILNGEEETPLFLASQTGQVEVSRLLIERGADMNWRDSVGWTPLHLASERGHVDIVQLLIDHGADPNVHCYFRFYSPLHLASAGRHLKVAQLLVQRGTRIDVFDHRQQTPLDEAAKNGDAEIACLLIDHGANLNTTDIDCYTPLHVASRGGHLDVVKLLLKRGADIDVLNNANKSAAELASENDNAEVASFLLKSEVDPDARHNLCTATYDTTQHDVDEDEKDEGTINALLHSASEEGNLDVVKSLLEKGADINARNTDRKRPLHLAANEENLEVVRLLIEKGAEVNPRDRLGWTPLHEASRNGSFEISQVLIDHGADVNPKKHNYWTPIHLSSLGIQWVSRHRGTITRTWRGHTRVG